MELVTVGVSLRAALLAARFKGMKKSPFIVTLATALGLLAIVGIFSIASSAEAAVLFEQNVGGDQFGTGPDGTAYQMFFATSTYASCTSIPSWNIATVTVWAKRTGGIGSSDLQGGIFYGSGSGRGIASSTNNFTLAATDTTFEEYVFEFDDFNIRDGCLLYGDGTPVTHNNLDPYWIGIGVGPFSTQRATALETSGTQIVAGGMVSGHGGGGSDTTDTVRILIEGTALSEESEITNVISPAESVTSGATGDVTFEFEFTSASPAVSDACIFMDDLTTGFNRVPVCEEILMSGPGITYQETIEMVSGHWYLWRAVLLDSNGQRVSQSALFSYQAGTAEQYQPILPEPSTDAEATTTLESIPTFFIGIPSLIVSKHPFAWLFEIASIVEDAFSTTTTNAYPELRLDFQQFVPASTTAQIDIVVFSTTTIAGAIPSGVLATMRTLIAASLWLGLMFYFFSRIRGLFRNQSHE